MICLECRYDPCVLVAGEPVGASFVAGAHCRRDVSAAEILAEREAKSAAALAAEQKRLAVEAKHESDAADKAKRKAERRAAWVASGAPKKQPKKGSR